MNTPAAQARSLLFVPADRLDRLDKALASPAHLVIVDLEDAVPPQGKPAARAALARRWDLLEPASRMRIAVRVNAATTPWHEDDAALLEALACGGLGAIVPAKTESVPPLARLSQRAAGVPLLPLVESAEGLAAVELIARAPGVARLAFGHLDFQLDLGMECGADERELDPVRFALVAASRRAGLPGPIDGVTVDVKDGARLELDAGRSRRFGFTGKLCIHPAQAAAVNEALGPTPEQADWARRVLAAAHGQGGAFLFEGAMVDAPVLARARRYLPLAA